MKKITGLFLVLLLTMLIGKVNAQNEKFKALFMYNFTKYVDWPGEKQSGDFVIGILGNSPMKKELKVIASKKKVGSQPIKLKVFNSISDIGSCHILFLPSGKSSSLPEVINKVSGKGVLVITDKSGLGRKGAGINYVLKGGNQDFEINKSSIQSQNLKINSALYALGTVIE